MTDNPIKGEESFTVDDASYTLVFDFNAICAVEEVFDLPISKIGEKMSRGMRASDLRTLIAAGLQAHHSGLSALGAGDLISKLGAQVAADHLARAMQAAFPEKEAASGKAVPRSRSNRRG